MITGTVTSNLDAVIRVVVHGPSRNEREVEAVIDTGFNGWLSLPSNLIDQLGLPWLTRGRVTLADGSEQECDVYSATVIWDGQPRRVPVDVIHHVQSRWSQRGHRQRGFYSKDVARNDWPANHSADEAFRLGVRGPLQSGRTPRGHGQRRRNGAGVGRGQRRADHRTATQFRTACMRLRSRYPEEFPASPPEKLPGWP